MHCLRLFWVEVDFVACRNLPLKYFLWMQIDAVFHRTVLPLPNEVSAIIRFSETSMFALIFCEISSQYERILNEVTN